MIQPDIFWTYGLASGLALSASEKIRREESIWINKYFITTVIWNTCVFVSTSVWFLWNFPAWQTMFVFSSHADMPGWLAAALIMLIFVQGMTGFLTTSYFIRQGKQKLAIAQLLWGHAIALFLFTFGWDGTGYKRMFYPGSYQDWASGVQYSLAAFMNSPIAGVQNVVGIMLVPSYAYLIYAWRKESRRAREASGV